jgi:hypothetical protein
MQETKLLTTIPGVKTFVLTLWAADKARPTAPGIYLLIDSIEAEQLVASLQTWLKSRATPSAERSCWTDACDRCGAYVRLQRANVTSVPDKVSSALFDSLARSQV